MCRLLGYCSRDSASVAGLLTEEGLGAFTETISPPAGGQGFGFLSGFSPPTQHDPRFEPCEPGKDRPRFRRRTIEDRPRTEDNIAWRPSKIDAIRYDRDLWATHGWLL